MKWTKDVCIEALRSIAGDGVVSTTMAEAYSKSLPTMAIRHFGSFGNACAAAGLRSSTNAKPRYEACIVDGCGAHVRSIGTPYCEMHYMRLRRNGVFERLVPSDKRGHTHGYVLLYLPTHPLRQLSSPYVFEHRAVFYSTYGEGPFSCHWCGVVVTWTTMHVDHLNDVRNDNRVENLVPSCPICNQRRGIGKMQQTMRERHGVWLELRGERKILCEWAEQIGISPQSLKARLSRGWPPERALTEPRAGRYGPAVELCGGYGNARR
jgi:hypothetical protein